MAIAFEGPKARAARIRAQLNAGEPNLIEVIVEAQQAFYDTQDVVRHRWLQLESIGYMATQAQPLHLVLGVTPSDRLVAHVAAYRTKIGSEIAPVPGRLFPHFFMEPIGQLLLTRNQIRQQPLSTTPAVVLSFASYVPPSRHVVTKTSFARDTFDQIVGGFFAALYLQLGTITG
jgi:hypothetical protein